MDKFEFAQRLQSDKARYYRIAYSYVKNEQDALDIVGDATYKALLNLRSLKNPEYFGTWMTRIVINCALDQLRRSSRVTFLDDSRCPAPNRLMINLVGVRDIDFDSLSESLLETSAVQDAYRMMVLDDSRFGVVIVLNPGWSCEVSEYTDPGALMLSFKEDAGAEEEGAVYYLRTEAMPYTEELGLLCEEYHAESPTQLKTLGGEYIVTLGQYGSESEALEALDALNSKYGDHGLFVASGAENEIPEN